MSGSGKRTDRLEIDKPVTPAMQRGWAPKTEKTKEAMNEESRTSDTPYCPVTTVKCKENAIPGRTLGTIRFQGDTSTRKMPVILTWQRERGQSQGALYNSTHPTNRSSTMAHGHVCRARFPRRRWPGSTIVSRRRSYFPMSGLQKCTSRMQCASPRRCRASLPPWLVI